MAKSFGINTDRDGIDGLGHFNGIIALSGALMAQQEGMRMLHVGLVSLLLGLQPHYWRGALFKCHFDRALAQYYDRIDRLPILIWARDCAWHQYQLYSNLQCPDLGYLPDDSNL